MDGDLRFGLCSKDEAWSCSQYWIQVWVGLSCTFALRSMFGEFACEFRYFVPFSIASRIV